MNCQTVEKIKEIFSRFNKFKLPLPGGNNIYILKNNAVYLKLPKHGSSTVLRLLERSGRIRYRTIYEHGDISELSQIDTYIQNPLLKIKKITECRLLNQFAHKFTFFSLLRDAGSYYQSLFTHLKSHNKNWSVDRDHARAHPWQLFWDNREAFNSIDSFLNLMEDLSPHPYLYSQILNNEPLNPRFFNLENPKAEVDFLTYDGFSRDLKKFTENESLNPIKFNCVQLAKVREIESEYCNYYEKL